MATKKKKQTRKEKQQAIVADLVQSLERAVAYLRRPDIGVVRTEPTCIVCGCTEYTPCDSDGFGTGCAWVFVNQVTNEGLCTGPRCLPKLAKKAGLY